MGEHSADVEAAGSPESLERLRHVLSWICVSVFAASFIALLGLSATPYWAPDNSWLTFLDRVWRVSGFLGICLWGIPYLGRLGRWFGELFSGKK